MSVPSSVPLASGSASVPVTVAVLVLAWAAFRAWQWRRLEAIRSELPGHRLATVVSVYQKARTGTKAIVRWDDGAQRGTRQDTWFAGRRVRTGTRVLVPPGSRYGRHNDNPDVLYADHVAATCGATGELFSRIAASGAGVLRRASVTLRSVRGSHHRAD